MFAMKKASILFAALAILLSDVMCAVVAYDYCNLVWCGRHFACSAPPRTAFLYAIPFGVGILACTAVAIVCRKKAKSA